MPKRSNLESNCPYKSNMVGSPEQIPDSQEDEAGSAGPCPTTYIQTSDEHRAEVVVAAGELYSKRAKYNKELTDILQMEQHNIKDQTELDLAQQTIDRAIVAIKERREKLEKAVETHKKREQEAQTVLQEINDGISQMNEKIRIAFLD